MHFALPPRKPSFPPPYARVSATSMTDPRRRQLRVISYVVISLLTIYGLFRWLGTPRSVEAEDNIPHDSRVLIVTVTDEKTMSEDYIRILMANRNEYAAKQGYQTFYTDVSQYTHLTNPSPTSWTLIPALRNALTLHPEVDYVWSLSPHALIMNTTLSLHSHIFGRLSNLMRRDIPVVPPDSVIHTFSHLTPSQAYLIISQDIDNLAHTSFFLRNTAQTTRYGDKSADSWSQFFLDAWFDPLYRSYAFQKAENHALEHLVQWHPTVLAKLVVIDQRLLNSYNHLAPTTINSEHKNRRVHDSQWQKGDLVVNFKGCMEQEHRDCEKEMRDYFAQWQTLMEETEGKKIKVQLQHEDHTSTPRPLPVVQPAASKAAEQQSGRKDS